VVSSVRSTLRNAPLTSNSSRQHYRLTGSSSYLLAHDLCRSLAVGRDRTHRNILSLRWWRVGFKGREY
jgi:hypothetical protein